MNIKLRDGQRILAYILKRLGFNVEIRPAKKGNLGMVITVDPCLDRLAPVYVRNGNRTRKMWN